MSPGAPARARDDVVLAVRATLSEAADPERAPQMQAYMKSTLPFYGIRMPDVRKRTRSVLDELRIDERSVWEATIRRLYDEASHREERYAALTLAAHRYYRAWARAPETLGLLRHLISTGGWWDLVDETSHRVGDVLLANRAAITPIVSAWATDSDLWVRRSSIICQVGHKTDTDLRLLRDVVEPNVDDRDFFIRKGIGWALREAAYVDADWVHAFIAGHPALSPLSVREATRHIGRSPSPSGGKGPSG